MKNSQPAGLQVVQRFSMVSFLMKSGDRPVLLQEITAALTASAAGVVTLPQPLNPRSAQSGGR